MIYTIGVIAALVLLAFLYLAYQAKPERPPYWANMLKKKTSELTEQEQKEMFEKSLTFGECATGELFGSLARLKEELPEDDFQRVLKAHENFGVGIAILYQGQETEVKEHGRDIAIEAFLTLKSLKKSLSLRYVNPWLMMM